MGLRLLAKRLWYSTQVIIVPEPALDAVPSYASRGFGMDHLIDMLNVNRTDWPAIGDVVGKLESCGMGVSWRRDDRYRVVRLKDPYPTSFVGVDANGKEEIMHIAYLRRHSIVKRVWFLCD